MEVFPSTFDGTPELTESIVITYEYDAANRLVFERGVLAKGRSYQVSYAWDGAGNMIRKTVTDYQGKTVVNTMTWTAENRLVRQTTSQGGVFDNPSFVEGDGKDQNTWAVARTGLNGAYLLYTYDHLMRHVLWEGAANSPSSKYILGPNRDELLAAYQKSGNALEKSFVYQNFRQDVLAANNLAKSDTFRRNYLPTGVAIAHDKGDVAPIRGPKNGKPLPPQAATNLPAGPLAFGWQGKGNLIQGGVDYQNRNAIGYRFVSVDPLLESAHEYQAYNYLSGNPFRFVDPEGLYVFNIATCSTQNRRDIHNAATIVKQAIFSSCITNSRGLRTLMQSAFYVVPVGCNNSMSECGKAVFGIGTVLNVRKLTSNSDGCGYNLHWGMYRRLASTFFHEIVHYVGRNECMARSCVWSCSRSPSSNRPLAEKSPARALRSSLGVSCDRTSICN